jgi:threonine dehydrogenase-like Zn-dependent dehydrogenase
LGAAEVFAVDIDPGRLELAKAFGATPLNAGALDPAHELQATGGVDVAIELVGSADTTHQAVRSLRAGGRAAVAGLTGQVTTISVYHDLMAREAELIGVMDHTIEEAREVLAMAERGALNLDSIVTETLVLDAAAVNARLDELERFGTGVRSVITP